MSRARHVTDRDIEDGLEIAALLIEQRGDVYWPLFERLEHELERRQSRSARLKLRLQKPTEKTSAGRFFADNIDARIKLQDSLHLYRSSAFLHNLKKCLI